MLFLQEAVVEYIWNKISNCDSNPCASCVLLYLSALSNTRKENANITSLLQHLELVEHFFLMSDPVHSSPFI